MHIKEKRKPFLIHYLENLEVTELALVPFQSAVYEYVWSGWSARVYTSVPASFTSQYFLGIFPFPEIVFINKFLIADRIWSHGLIIF